MLKDKIIRSKTIYLREISIEDAKDPYLSWLNDSEINMYLESRFSDWSKENLYSYIKELSSNDNEILFAICSVETDIHIGNIKIGPINWNHKFADIGIIVGDKSQWGKGIAAEAIKSICHFGFDELKLNKLTAGCYEINIGSMKAFNKVGFSEEGRLKKKFISDEGYQDHVLLGLLEKDFVR